MSVAMVTGMNITMTAKMEHRWKVRGVKTIGRVVRFRAVWWHWRWSYVSIIALAGGL